MFYYIDNFFFGMEEFYSYIETTEQQNNDKKIYNYLCGVIG